MVPCSSGGCQSSPSPLHPTPLPLLCWLAQLRPPAGCQTDIFLAWCLGQFPLRLCHRKRSQSRRLLFKVAEIRCQRKKRSSLPSGNVINDGFPTLHLLVSVVALHRPHTAGYYLCDSLQIQVFRNPSFYILYSTGGFLQIKPCF